MHREADRFSRFASVSRALDFGPAARAHAFAPLAPRRSKAHVPATAPTYYSSLTAVFTLHQYSTQQRILVELLLPCNRDVARKWCSFRVASRGRSATLACVFQALQSAGGFSTPQRLPGLSNSTPKNHEKFSRSGMASTTRPLFVAPFEPSSTVTGV